MDINPFLSVFKSIDLVGLNKSIFLFSFFFHLFVFSTITFFFFFFVCRRPKNGVGWVVPRLWTLFLGTSNFGSAYFFRTKFDFSLRPLFTWPDYCPFTVGSRLGSWSAMVVLITHCHLIHYECHMFQLSLCTIYPGQVESYANLDALLGLKGNI